MGEARQRAVGAECCTRKPHPMNEGRHNASQRVGRRVRRVSVMAENTCVLIGGEILL